MKRLLIIILLTALFLIPGCFKVERNNPFDPGADNYKEQQITLIGDCYRGNSDMALPFVTIEFYQNGDYVTSTNSDNSGYYEISIPAGTYVIYAYKPGWKEYYHDITLTGDSSGYLEKNTTKFHDLNMVIEKYSFEDYPLDKTPEAPWEVYTNHSSTGVGGAISVETYGTVGMNVYLTDDEPPAGAYTNMTIQSFPDQANFDTALFATTTVVFPSTMQNNLCQIEFLGDFPTSGYDFKPIVTFELDDNYNLTYETSETSSPMTIKQLAPSERDVPLTFIVRIDSFDRQVAYLSVFNHHTEQYIMQGTQVDIFDVEPLDNVMGVDYFVTYFNTGSNVMSRLSVLDVSVF